MKVTLNKQVAKDVALDIWEDLGRTRLAGVAVGLAIALLVITALVFRPISTPAVSATRPAAIAPVMQDEVSFTVPGQEPIQMSDVDLSAPRDPFRDLDGLDSAESDQTLIAAGKSVQAAAAASAPSDTSGSGGGSNLTGYDDTSSLLPLDDLDTAPAPAPNHTPDAPRGDLGRTPAQEDPAPAPVTDYSYAADIQFGLVDDLKRYASVQRLGLVPSRREPLLMYLGVSTGHKTAVFMVDSRLSQGGEGECVPKASLCTFLELRPTPDRDEHHFRDADGNEYLLRLRRLVRTTASAGSLGGRDVAELPGSPPVIDGAR